MPEIHVRCPATSANLGPGMDALGIAVALENTYRIAPTDGRTTLTINGPGANRIPQDPERNLIVRAFQTTRAALGEPAAPGLALTINLTVPPCSGLGSSATATVAGILAANALAANPLDPRAVIELATRLEGHPDNVVPCLLGGLCVAVTTDDGRTVWQRGDPVDPPSLVLALPTELELSTPAMRAILPETVSFQDAVFNLGRSSLLTFALLTGVREHLATALQDRLHQPYRGGLIPGFDAVCAAARDAGAFGTVISGSGPTLLAMAPADVSAAVGDAMVAAWAGAGVAAEGRVVAISAEGARAERLD